MGRDVRVGRFVFPDPMSFSFCPRVASHYGVDEAIMLNCLAFWIATNKANGRNLHPGEDGIERTWTYNSVAAWAELFPFWTPKQVRRILQSLVDQGVVLADNFAPNPFDKSAWYAFVNEEKALAALFKNGDSSDSTDLPKWADRDENGDSSDSSVCPNGQIDSTERANRRAQTGKSSLQLLNVQLQTEGRAREAGLFGGAPGKDGAASDDVPQLSIPRQGNDPGGEVRSAPENSQPLDQHPHLLLFREFYPVVSINAYQKELLAGYGHTDALRTALGFWCGNGYNGGSVQRILRRADEERTGRTREAKHDPHAPPPTMTDEERELQNRFC